MVEEKKSIGRRWGVMKQKKTMVILILILAVLASIYGGLKAWGKKAAEKEAGAAAEKITVMDLIFLFEWPGDHEFCQGRWNLETGR